MAGKRAARRPQPGFTMSWVYLFTAGLFEIGWPVGLKWAQEPGKQILGAALASFRWQPAAASFIWPRKRSPSAPLMRCGRALAPPEHFWSGFGYLATRAA